jgi:hypothetical protein
MSIKTISKITCFVIPLLVAVACADNSFVGGEGSRAAPENSGFQSAEIIAHIASKEINESSGLAVSKCRPDLFFTHNDSGDGPFIYAFNSEGRDLGKFRLTGATNIDWEDISSVRSPAGECFIYVGEIGDNEHKRDEHAIYRIREPSLSQEAAQTSPAEIMRFRYPEERHNAEALLVNAQTGAIYVVTKEVSGPAIVYRLKPLFDSPDVQTATEIAKISLPASPVGFVTGGDISADGNRVGLCDYFAGYEFTLPSNATSFDEIWRQPPAMFDLGPRQIGESVAYAADGNAVFATTERLNAPLIRALRK